MVKYKFAVIVEQDENGSYIGSVPESRGCHSYGASMDELLKNVKEAIEVNLENMNTGLYLNHPP